MVETIYFRISHIIVKKLNFGLSIVLLQIRNEIMKNYCDLNSWIFM